jgi:glutamate-ammonia-ligase adenylyltransferase
VLRRFRRTEGVRIAWRDLAGLAAIDDTLAEQSALADACIRIALEMLETRARARFGTPRAGDGTPQSLLVLGMGKLGGRELNFSSDIDLIFLYGERGATDGARSLDNGDFFTRLGQELIRALQETTAEGFVYRVDMRLRPFGSSGPLVMHLEQLEQYLLTQAREWERFALVKARPVTGDPATVAEVDGLLRPFVFRRYLDFGAFEALRDLKLRLEREVERKGLHGNVKYGRGGIREVEFIAQAFQLIRGGRESRLRTRGLLDALEALRHLGELEPATVDALSAAYRHLRAVENRLQAWGDERAHDLPVDPGARARLAWTLGEADWSAFGARLDGHMAAVHECFGEVFNVSEDEEPVPRDPLAEAWEGTVDAEVAEARLGDAGFDEPAEIRRRLETLRASSRYRSLTRTARERFDRLVPLLLAEAGRVQAPGRTLGRLLTLMEAVARRSVYLSLLTEHAAARGRLVELCAASPWIAEFVTRHPILLDELIDPGSLYAPPDRASVEREIAEALEGIGDDDLESQMDALRQVRQANVLRVAAVDITGRLPLMRVSDRLTWIAEAMLEAVHRLVRRQAVARYGRPRALLDDGEREPGFGIVAYGKLGGIELGYGSDLDLVFLHEGGEDRGTDGERAVDNATFFARLAQRMVHFLNTPTPAGTLYEIDTRLRPNGSAGLLVSTLPAFARYQGESAWTWEHQALVRARMIVGPEPLRTRFEAVRAEVLRRGRDRPALARAVVDMRDRMRRELSKGSADRFDLKQDRGGVADIEFMVQYGVLAGAHATPALVDFTDNIRLLEALATAGELAAGDASLLTDAYRAFRTRIHRLALLDAPAIVEPDAELAGYREAVTRIWSHWIEAQAGDPHESGH